MDCEPEVMRYIPLPWSGPDDHRRFVRDRILRESLSLNGRVPELATVVTVERAFFHCGKCILRSKLWDSREQSEQPQARTNGWLRMFTDKAASP